MEHSSSETNSSSASQGTWAFCGTRRIITVFTTVRNWPISWARWITSTH